eukprot:190676_1
MSQQLQLILTLINKFESDNKCEEKMNNNEDCTSHTYCSTTDLYNAIQFPQQKLFIDIRSQKEYNESHIKHFINIPINSNQNKIDKIIEKSLKYNNNICNTYAMNIYCYCDKNTVENELDKKFYNIIEESIINFCNKENKSIKDESDFYEYDSFNILSVEYNIFFNTFKFLCVDEYDSPIMLAVSIRYPSIIINNKLYLGDYGDASSREVMHHLNITHIVNVSKLDNVFENNDQFKHLKYIHFPIEDDSTTQINKILMSCINFMNNAFCENNGNNN